MTYCVTYPLHSCLYRLNLAENPDSEAPVDPIAQSYAEQDQQAKHGKKEKAVIGITGVSRCGKGWVTHGLTAAIDKANKAGDFVGQEEFWLQACQVNVRGQTRTSEDEPGCTNNEGFAEAIKAKKAEKDIIIAEGFQLLQDDRVTALLDSIFLIELDQDEARKRRTQPRDAKLNPNPLKPEDFDDLLWPAHERYMKEKVTPLGQRVIKLRSPTNQTECDALVHQILHDAGVM